MSRYAGSEWGFVASVGGTHFRTDYIDREMAEQLTESPAGTREDYLALWLVPPFYMAAGEGEFRARQGNLPLAWDYLRGKQELPEDFLNDPNAWLERVKREEYPTYDVRPVAGTKAWSAKNRARPGVGKGMSKTDMVVVMYGDRSLYGAAVANERTTNPSYWGYDRGEPVALFRASVPHEIVGFSDFEKTKPVTLVEALEGQGTMNQWFDDGYKGWGAVAPYVKPKKPFYVSHEYDKDFGPFKRESNASDANRAGHETETVAQRMVMFNELIGAYQRSWNDTHTKTVNARHIVAAVKKHPTLMQQIPWDVFDLAVRDAAANRAGAGTKRGKVIEGVDELFEYVNRLGFAGSGSMHYRQQQLGAVYDALLAAAGGDFPFRARFHTHKSKYGFTYPWLGEFEIDGKNGHVVVNMSNVKS